MTISPREREENVDYVVKTMMLQLGDDRYDQVLFDVLEPEFQSVLPTTWAELEKRRYWIEEHGSTMGGHDCYRLTALGWREGLRRIDQLESAETKERLRLLAAGLKKCVKGRKESKWVLMPELASEVGLPEGWIANVLESELLENSFPNHVMSVDWDFSDQMKRTIVVPVDFGMARQPV